MTCLFLLSLIFSSSSYAGNCTFFVSLSRDTFSELPAADQFGINRNSVHLIKKSSSKQNRVPCPKCSVTLSNKSSLERHMKSKTCEKKDDPDAKFKCKTCFNVYQSQGSLNRHLGKKKICTRIEKSQIPCKFCDRCFTQKCSLVRHLKGACNGIKHRNPDDKNDNQEILTTSNTEH